MEAIINSEGFSDVSTLKERDLVEWHNMLEGNLLRALAETKDKTEGNTPKFSLSSIFFNKKKSIKIHESFELVLGRGLTP